MKRVGVGLLLGLITILHSGRSLTPLSSPQQSRNSEEVLRVGVSEVLLDAVITDKKGRQVKDLRPEEVQIYEDGALQKIASFRLVTAGSGSGPPGTAGQPANPPQTTGPSRFNLIMLVFDRINLYGRKMAKDAALAYFRELGTSDYVSVMAIDRSLRVLQPFTQDTEKLNASVALALDGTPQQFAETANAVREAVLQAQLSQEVADASASQAGAGGADGGQIGAAAAAAKLNQVVSSMLRQNAVMDATVQGRATVESLINVVRGAQAYPGRKAVVFFGEQVSLPTEVVQRFRDLISAANRANVSFYCIDASGLNKEGELQSMANELKTLGRVSQTQLTRRSGAVTQEEVLLSENADNALRLSKQNTLLDLAQSTGGTLITNTNDLSPGFQMVSEDIHSYYELSYTPTNPNLDGAFRKIEVKLKRPGLVVRTRQGYYAFKGDDATVTPFEIPLLSALDAKVLPRDLSFRSASLLYPTRTQRSEVVLYLEIPLAGFAFPVDRNKKEYQAKVSALISVKNALGRTVERFSQEFPLRGPETQAPETQQRNLVFYRTIELAPGRYTVESVVRDAFSEKVGVKRSVLMVPARKVGAVSLSSVVLVKRVDPIRADANLIETPLNFNQQTVVPNLNPEIRLKDWQDLALYFVAAAPRPGEAGGVVDVVISKEGKPIGHMGEKPLPPPDEKGRIPYLTSMPISTFSSGTYEVSVVVRQGETASTGTVIFSVE